MPEQRETAAAAPEAAPAPESPKLDGGAYEIIRNRLLASGAELRARLEKLNAARKQTFGAIDLKLLGTGRVATANNCMPRGMIALGGKLVFGYNVHLGLRSETRLDDVFAMYEFDGSAFRDVGLSLLNNPEFARDFREFHTYYKKARFAKFARVGPFLHLVFHVGDTIAGLKTFKWALDEKGALAYVDNRSDHEYRFPPQHEFEWTRCTREMHRQGQHPHISIEDRVFVETVGGDLTVKVEDNTDTGSGVYAEPVDNPDQTLDDAEIYYAAVGNLILLKIRPYQEKEFRYLVYSEKARHASRIDSIADSCVLLPEDHGVIFSDGYYLQTGEHKKFELDRQEMLFESRVASPNGEDYLYVFYNRLSGAHVLLSYNLISQRVDTPVVCAGYSLFEDGRMIYFKKPAEPQKYHAVQIWQTPYTGPDYEPPAHQDNYLYKIGNRDIVRCMAGCGAVLNLVAREDSYANLYLDIVRAATDIADAYFWLGNAEAFDLRAPLLELRDAAGSAIEEFEKVLRLKRAAADGLNAVAEKTRAVLNRARSSRFESIDEFVTSLGGMRSARGELVSLREVRYMDLAAVERLEAEVAAESDALSGRCVEFLLEERALDPYRERVAAQTAAVAPLQKAAEAKRLDGEIQQTGAELEMLIDIVGNLKIDDATHRTAIVDAIGAIYAELNQARSLLRNRARELAAVEGAGEFASQMKLLGQAVVNFLDVCDTPEKPDEYLGKLMVQLEEMEGRFADFDEFVEQLARKREEIYSAFESRKVQLREARNRKADSLLRSAERILKGVRTRAASLCDLNAINGYFASDLMVDKARSIAAELEALGDPVKAGDLQSRLKTIREDAVRQLKDRQELFVGGENVIRFGMHHFSVNTQALDLATVLREGEMYLHLSGTAFFEKIDDTEFLATRASWEQDCASENQAVYRGCYLAYLLLQELRRPGAAPDSAAARRRSNAELEALARDFMAPRYAEGYVKGVHDHDAAIFLRALLELDARLGLLRHHSSARALAEVFWRIQSAAPQWNETGAALKGLGAARRLFPGDGAKARHVAALGEGLRGFAAASGLFDPELAADAAEYLFAVLCGDAAAPISAEAAALYRGLSEELEKFGAAGEFRKAAAALSGSPAAQFALVRDWVAAYAAAAGSGAEHADEAAALLFCGDFDTARVSAESATRELAGLVGDHPTLAQGRYRLNFTTFMRQLERFATVDVPRFERFAELKRRFLDRAREQMRLDEFKPRVLTSFVRNQLLNDVYLPLIGDNLAKQIGVAGENKRTDNMGLLLLVSPPGYGKTTLMEYVANRLGIVFMKVNGPALGHGVTSLDPAEAKNAAAREELAKLNLALEMGDNVMLYLDDIQHTNPELLQKFISLCDATRKIEGVYKGRTRTYDLRGKKVAVVMAGNPYTESGTKFRIPDMLANRADTYNLGDIVGGNAEAFRLSYLENALTSNPVLARLSARSQRDVRAVVRLAEGGPREAAELEGSYAAEELEEFVSVMRKLLRVRDVILTVNQEYIRSAATEDEFRTEPPFKLQGSYRNMNRIAERVLPVMNDAELEALLDGHYENEAQTLTSGAEANLLKYRELTGKLGEAGRKRWDEIRQAFRRNQVFRGAGGEDRAGQVVAQLGVFADGLREIRAAIQGGVERAATPSAPAETVISEATLARVGAMLKELRAALPAAAGRGAVEASLSPATLAALGKLLEGLRPTAVAQAAPAGAPALPAHIEVVNRVPQGMVHVLREQFELLRTWMTPPAAKDARQETERLQHLRGQVDAALLAYENLIRTIEKGNAARGKSGRIEASRADADDET